MNTSESLSLSESLAHLQCQSSEGVKFAFDDVPLSEDLFKKNPVAHIIQGDETSNVILKCCAVKKVCLSYQHLSPYLGQLQTIAGGQAASIPAAYALYTGTA